jgi:tRNA (cmo5U34)-methyltransferase
VRIRELFDQCATAYDQDRPKLVPCFDQFYGAAMCMIPFPPDAELHVLDLGAGTGLFSSMVTKAFPAARLHLTDISEDMLAKAKKRFSEMPHVTYAVQDHLQLSADSEFDLVLSALSIHHLEHAAKMALFQKVFRALRPGGMFINADQALGSTPQQEDEYERQWLADVTANSASAESLERARERMREDKNAQLSDQMIWLSKSGFRNVTCVYTRYRFVVYGGTKEGSYE